MFSFQVWAELAEVKNLSLAMDTKLWGYLVWLITQVQCHMPCPHIYKTHSCKQTCTQKSGVLKRRGQEVLDKQGPDKRGH